MSRSLLLVGLGIVSIVGMATAQSASSQSSAEDRLAEQLGSATNGQSRVPEDNLRSRLEDLPAERRVESPVPISSHGKFTVGGAERTWSQCPAWQDNAYEACECAATSQIQDSDLEVRRKKRVAWRTACGVMALPAYSAGSGGPKQLKCEQRSAMALRIIDQLEGAGLSRYRPQASAAINQWQERLQCEGSPVPARQAAARCAVGERIYPDDQRFGAPQQMTCSNGTKKGFAIRRFGDFVFQVKTEDGLTQTLNVQNNYDPETQAYYLDAGFVAGLICRVEPDASLLERLRQYIIREAEKQAKDKVWTSESSSICIGVRG